MLTSIAEEKYINNTITKAMTLLLAIAGGISVANIYYNQPYFQK